MTSRCKFGIGNQGLARVAMGTVSGSNPLAEAAQMQIRRRQRKRTQCSTESSRREGRDSANCAKANVAPSSEAHADGVTSPVSRRSHVEKVMRGNLGDRMVSRVVIQPFCWMALVASTISSTSEGSGKAPCGVREARSIDDGSDSITLQERRGLAWMHGRSEFMDESIPERVGGLASA
jgi:hypothetical protein